MIQLVNVLILPSQRHNHVTNTKTELSNLITHSFIMLFIQHLFGMSTQLNIQEFNFIVMAFQVNSITVKRQNTVLDNKYVFTKHFWDRRRQRSTKTLTSNIKWHKHCSLKTGYKYSYKYGVKMRYKTVDGKLFLSKNKKLLFFFLLSKCFVQVGLYGIQEVRCVDIMLIELAAAKTQTYSLFRN